MFLTENANNAENSAAELKNAAGAFLPFKPLKPSADSLPPFPSFERHISYPFLELFFIWHKLHYTKFSPFNTAKRTKLKA